MKKIAFFDFDGTITTHDTMLELVKFYTGKKRYYTGIIKLLPALVGMKLKLVDRTYTKEKLLEFYFKGLSLTDFQKICNDFIDYRLPTLIRPKALQTIQKLQNEGVQIVVVSASADNWIKSWCDRNNIIFIGSCLEVIDGRLTGKLKGPNCNHEEKVRRIKEKYQLSDYSEIYCYGDTKGDKPMLMLATRSFYKPFR